MVVLLKPCDEVHQVLALAAGCVEEGVQDSDHIGVLVHPKLGSEPVGDLVDAVSGVESLAKVVVEFSAEIWSLFEGMS